MYPKSKIYLILKSPFPTLENSRIDISHYILWCIGFGPPALASVDQPIPDLLSLECNFRYYLESPFGTNFGLLTHVLFWTLNFLLLFCQNFDFQKISATHTILGLAGPFIFWPRRVKCTILELAEPNIEKILRLLTNFKGDIFSTL